MRVIAAIALNTFREAVRNRILYLILIFALLLLTSSGVVRDLSIAAHDRVVRDFGLACISLFGLAVAILVGIGLVYNELDKKSIYTIVSKPIARWQFLLGKYFGLLLTIYVIMLIMLGFFLAVIHYQAQTTDEALLKFMAAHNLQDLAGWPYLRYVLASACRAVGRGALNVVGIGIIEQTRHVNTIVFLTAMELAIVTAFAVLYSSFSTPTLSAIFTLLTFVAGRLNEDIWAYARKLEESGATALVSGSLKQLLAMAACVVAPNLGAFKASTLNLNAGGDLGIHWFTLWDGVFYYGVLYTASILCLSIVIFRSRNFK